jgi:eukaryotic-like serine/threonine-protein kinase
MSDSTSRTHSVAEDGAANLKNEVSGLEIKSEESVSYVPTIDHTVIAQSPIAGPNEFYPTGTVATLARVLIGQQLDHFQLHELIGGGGMGAVFRASDTRLDRIVAVKVIPSLGHDLETLRRFRIEAQSAAKLDHPHIARVYYVGETEAWNYIVFEYVEGTNLRDLIVRQGPLSVDDAVCFACQVAEALQHAADRSVVHRDIKPSNVLVTSEGIIKVVDMGLARTTALDRSTNDLTASGVTLGTFDYISPEQARDPRAADVRSDLYSLGCTLYYLLIGRPPYPDGTAMQKLLMHGTVKADDPSDFRDDVSADLTAIIQKLMAKRPEDRYQQPSDLIADLQCLANLENLTKSQQAVGIVVAPAAIEHTLFEVAFPWVIGFLAIVGSTWYLHSEYEASASFAIPMEIELNQPIAETIGKVSPTDRPITSLFERASNLDRTIEFSSTETVGVSPAPESLVGPMLPDLDATENMDASGLRVSSLSIPAVTGSSYNAASQNPSTVTPGPNPSKARVLWLRPFESAELTSDSTIDHRVITGNLEQALAAADLDSQIEEIWLDDDVWLVDKPLGLKRPSLVIRSAPDRKARIEVRIPRNFMPTSGGDSISDRIVAFNVGSNQLVLNDLDLFSVPPDSGSGSLCLLGLAPGGSVRIMRSTVTMSNNAATWKSSCIGASATISSPMAASNRTANEPLRIVMEDAVVRGEGDLMSLDAAQRTELRWENGLVALSGRMFELAGARESSKTPPTIRVDLEQVTIAARQGFARIRLTKEHSFPICLTRDSKNCVYASDRNFPLVAIENIDLEDVESIPDAMAAWLDLRGRDNAYDEQIDTVLKWTSPSGLSKKIGFESVSSEYFSDRAPETTVRWLTPRPVQKIFEQQTAGEYLQREGNFRPGFLPELLPNH